MKDFLMNIIRNSKRFIKGVSIKVSDREIITGIITQIDLVKMNKKFYGRGLDKINGFTARRKNIFGIFFPLITL